MFLPELDDFDFNAPKKLLNGIVDGGSASELIQKISKTFSKGGEEKRVNYVHPVNWINPKGENQKGNIMINAETFVGALFI